MDKISHTASHTTIGNLAISSYLPVMEKEMYRIAVDTITNILP